MQKMIALAALYMVASVPCFAEGESIRAADPARTGVNSQAWDKVDKAEADLRETRAMTEKATLQLQQARLMRKQQQQESLAKAEYDAEMAELAARQASAEAAKAKAQADKAEEELRLQRAVMQNRMLPEEGEARMAQIGATKLEAITRLSKMRGEHEATAH